MDLRPYFQINRKISRRITQLFAMTAFTPNMITFFGLLSGLTAGLCMAGGDRASMLWGALCMHMQFLFDNVDGELSRLKGMRTRFGKWFDLVSDVVVDQALWFGLFLGSLHAPVASQAIWFASIGSILNGVITVRERFAGVSTSVHANRPSTLKKNKFLLSLLEVLSHNGDSIFLVWLMALIGDPVVFLVCGAAYINTLWIWRLAVNFRKLVPMRALKLAGQILASAAGLWILHATLKDVSLGELKSLLMKGGLGFAFVFLVYPLTCFFHAAGHYTLFSRESRKKMGFRRFFAIYIAGESINKVTPFVDVGGEPFKILLAYKRGMAGLDESVIAAWVARILFILTEIVYIFAGLLVLWYVRPSEEMTYVSVGGIVMSAGFVGILIYAQRRGLVRFIARVAGRLNGELDAAGTADLTARTERGLEEFYKRRKSAFALGLLWNLAGWTVFLFEVYFTFHILGIEMTLAQAFIIQSLLQAVTTVTFFIPAGIGSQENGLAFLLMHLGFSATHGFALSLIKRARQFVWALLGPLWYLAHARAADFLAKRA